MSSRAKVAVVTGAASGIGRALAERCAHEGMKVVLADVQADALTEAVEELRGSGSDVQAIPTDVSHVDQVEALARTTVETYGGVHLLFNNAGVGAGTSVGGSTLADWQWVLGVNLWGVIHGVHSFVPLMLQQGSEGHIVNTASMVGLTAGPGLSPYRVSKYGVVALSETLYYELMLQRAKIGVSVLCPGWVHTRITEAERNRPAELQNEASDVPLPAEAQPIAQTVRHLVETGTPPVEIAEIVFQAIQENRFYILPHPQWKPAIQARTENILEERNPTLEPLPH